MLVADARHASCGLGQGRRILGTAEADVRGMLGGIIGNVTDRLACETYRKVQRSFLDGLREKRNHDLARAIRRSQLLALRVIVRSYENLSHDKRWYQLVSPAEDISKPLTTWITHGLLRDTALDRDLSSLAEEDQAAWNARLQLIESEIERVFVDPPPHDGEPSHRLLSFRQAAEHWVLDETYQQVRNPHDWERFKSLLLEGSTSESTKCPAWWPLFRAFLGEEIKTNETPRLSSSHAATRRR